MTPAVGDEPSVQCPGCKSGDHIWLGGHCHCPFCYCPAAWSDNAQRGDVIVDGTGNMFCYHDKHGWFGLASNQPSARGAYTVDELAEPVRLLVRNREPVTS